MDKENQYLAEKVISNIKKFKVIDEIIVSSPNSFALEVKNTNDVFKITNNKLVTEENKNIQDNVQKPNIFEIPKKISHATNVNDRFNLIFSDDCKDVDKEELYKTNHLDKIKKGNNQSIIKPKKIIYSKNSGLKVSQKGMGITNMKQAEFKNDLNKEENIDSYNLDNDSNVVSMVDLLSENNLNSIDDLNNIVNINDVYDDLGRNFQDDLINQYSELDKSVSRTTNELKYSYLPKRKIRDILFDKYNIKNEECVNELYSMAFNNK